MEKKPKPVKPNNVKAPRFGKSEFTYQVVRRELWEQWKKDTHNTLSFNEFKKIWVFIAEEICRQVVQNAQGVKLPFFNGEISLKYVEMKKAPLSVKASQAAGKPVPYLDWHTDRRPGKICWIIREAVRRNRWVSLYGFAPCRALAKAAKDDGFMVNPGLFQLARATEHNKK